MHKLPLNYKTAHAASILLVLGLALALAGCSQSQSQPNETALAPNARVRPDGGIVVKGVPPIEKEPQLALSQPTVSTPAR